MEKLTKLNESQQQAVTHTEGPLLILAGPGSGKTRVITHRIAHLVQQGIPLSNILALTFTNKAAQEMSRRVEEITFARTQWIATFHSFCVKILRLEVHRLGYESDFTIYDTDDQKKAIKQVLKDLDIDSSGINLYLNSISKYKNNCVLPQEIPTQHYFSRILQKVYLAYQEFLQKNNALDFDDLLLKTLDLFDNYSDVLESYQDKFHYILVDEFQDTNLPQYRIARALASKRQNICATGDPDQSIYSWRGANLNNILNFERDFPNTQVIRLEQNYRSTQTILELASALIAHNRLRKEKKLWTENPRGSTIDLFCAYDEAREAEHICREIKKLTNQYSYSEMAIFYRVNSQSRIIETALARHRIPYVIIGALEFYQRAEIKDALAYLRVLVNPRDEVALLRIINTPARGISQKTQRELRALANEHRISIYQVLANEKLLAQFPARAKKALLRFFDLLEFLRENQSSLSLSKHAEEVLKQSGYIDHVKKNDVKKEEERLNNLFEFLDSVIEFEKNYSQAGLGDLLEHIALISNSDKLSDVDNHVSLMTLHAAKGLEFPVVFILGLNHGLFPHSRSETKEEIEEERRLLFVGLTRAQQKLSLSYTKYSSKANFRSTYIGGPSPFLRELPEQALQLQEIH